MHRTWYRPLGWLLALALAGCGQQAGGGKPPVAPASSTTPASSQPAASQPAGAGQQAAAPAPGGAPQGAVPQPGSDQGVAEFYRGKTLTIVVGSSAGGAYDQYARLLSRHIGRHIPGNPTVIVENRAGAGGLVAANYLYNQAPKDGTVIGTFNRSIPMQQALGSAEARFDATRFVWLGSLGQEVSVCVARTDAPVQKFDDAFRTSIKVGASGPGVDSYIFPHALNTILGTRFEVVAGYPGGNEVDLAVEKGELQGRCGWSWTSAGKHHLVTGKKVNILVQLSTRAHPDLRDVPLIMDYAREPLQKELLAILFAPQVMSWPYVAPPGIPADRAAALRQAFARTFQDPQFAEDARKSQLAIDNPVNGADLEKVVAQLLATPKEKLDRLRSFLQSG